MSSAWTPDEKRALLVALKQHGTSNIEEIQKYLPRKTITEIRFAFEKYSKLAQAKFQEEEKLRQEDSSINQWIKILKRTNLKSNGVTDILPRVLKYIALFEKRPEDNEVNLSDCYMVLSEMCSAVATKNLSPGTSQFFYDSISELAQNMQRNDLSRQKSFINTIETFDHLTKPNTLRTYKRRRERNGNVVLNPLDVPSDLLQSNKT